MVLCWNVINKIAEYMSVTDNHKIKALCDVCNVPYEANEEIGINDEILQTKISTDNYVNFDGGRYDTKLFYVKQSDIRNLLRESTKIIIYKYINIFLKKKFMKGESTTTNIKLLLRDNKIDDRKKNILSLLLYYDMDMYSGLFF